MIARMEAHQIGLTIELDEVAIQLFKMKHREKRRKLTGHQAV